MTHQLQQIPLHIRRSKPEDITQYWLHNPYIMPKNLKMLYGRELNNVIPVQFTPFW